MLDKVVIRNNTQDEAGIYDVFLYYEMEKQMALSVKTVNKITETLSLENKYVSGVNLLIEKFTFLRAVPKILNSFFDSLLDLSKKSLISLLDIKYLDAL